MQSEKSRKENIPNEPQGNKAADNIPESPVLDPDAAIVPEVTCVYCNKIFASPHALEQHQQVSHQGKKAYECPVCGKHFTHRSSRTIHVRVHTGQRPYECHVCKKRFRVTSHLRDHVRTHTGERPFKCVVCGRGFKQSSDMKKHRKTHNKTSDYDNTCNGISYTVLNNEPFPGPTAGVPLANDVTPRPENLTSEPLKIVIKVERNEHSGATPQGMSNELMTTTGKESKLGEFPPSGIVTSPSKFVATAAINHVYNGNHWGPPKDKLGSYNGQLLSPPQDPDYHRLGKSPEYPLITTSYDVSHNDVTDRLVRSDEVARGDVIMATNSVTSSGFRHDDVMGDDVSERNGVTAGISSTEVTRMNEGCMEVNEQSQEVSAFNETTENVENSVEINKLQCNTCDEFLNDREELMKHKCLRRKTKPFKCHTCAKVFGRQTLLRQHMVLHQGTKRFKFKCNYCGRAFRHRSHLRDHERIHTGERPFQCTFCPKAFKQSSDLRKHENLHTGMTRYRCEKCTMDFKRCDALKKHVATHPEGEVTLMKCGKCHSLFASTDGDLSHTCQSRNFLRCQLCVKRFSTAEELRQHCLVDHGSRPNSDMIKCEFCNLEMQSLGELEQHLESHELKKTHKCTICKEHFSLICQLENHMKLHSTVKETNIDQQDQTNTNIGEEDMIHGEEFTKGDPIIVTPSLTATLGDGATPYDKSPHSYDFIPSAYQALVPVSAYSQIPALHPITPDHQEALRKLSESNRYENPVRKPSESSYYERARKLSESDRYNTEDVATGERLRYVQNPTVESHFEDRTYYEDIRELSESSDDVRDFSEGSRLEEDIVRKMLQSDRHDVTSQVNPAYRYDYHWSPPTEQERARSGDKHSSATIGYQMSAKLKYTCLTCTHAYYNEQDLLNHMCDIKSETFYECSVCDTEFHYYEELLEHMKTHWRTLVYLRCPSCGEKFRNEESLRQHNLTHTRVATSKKIPSPHSPKSPGNDKERHVSNRETVIAPVSDDTPRGVSPSLKNQQEDCIKSLKGNTAEALERRLSNVQALRNPYMSYIGAWKTTPTAFMNVFNPNPPIMVSHAMYGRGLR